VQRYREHSQQCSPTHDQSINQSSSHSKDTINSPPSRHLNRQLTSRVSHHPSSHRHRHRHRHRAFAEDHQLVQQQGRHSCSRNHESAPTFNFLRQSGEQQYVLGDIGSRCRCDSCRKGWGARGVDNDFNLHWSFCSRGAGGRERVDDQLRLTRRGGPQHEAQKVGGERKEARKHI
jgi:hypothetical protein